MTRVIVFIPGIMGSVLQLGDKVIWPGPLSSLAFSYKLMPELLNPNLQATDCIRSFVLPQYADLIDTFGNWGFREKNHTLFVAAYDWRRSNADSAKTLDSCLRKIISVHNQNVHISLVAHSMGGLVARYFLESGEYTSSAAWNATKDLTTIATPHRGAAVALPIVAGLEKRLFLSAMQVKQLCDDPRYPSAYELLPQQTEPVVWNGLGTQTGIVPVDIYDAHTISSLQISPQNMASAHGFHQRLRVGKRPEHVSYFCFAGTRETTATYVRIRMGAKGQYPDKVDLKSGGDGTVPTWSSSLPGTRLLYVPGEHGTIYQGDSVKKHLGMLMGQPDILAAGAPNELFVDPPVAEPGAEVRIRLIFPENVTDIKGEIAIEKMNLDEQGSPTGHWASTDQPRKITYSGPEIDAFLLKITAPLYRGHYRIFYKDMIETNQTQPKELIVQR